jgi:hypothetical protein
LPARYFDSRHSLGQFQRKRPQRVATNWARHKGGTTRFGIDNENRLTKIDVEALQNENILHGGSMKTLILIIDLPFRFIFAFVSFTFRGWIGWVGIVLIALKLFGVIGWPWWVAALPLEYGVLYCLYMTIDGALYRAGRKGIGGYARFTTTDEQLACAELEQAVRNVHRARGKE